MGGSLRTGSGGRTTWATDACVVGSGPGCDVTIAGLRPRHARIRRVGERWLVESLGDWAIQHVGPSPARLVWLRDGDAVVFAPGGPSLTIEAAGTDGAAAVRDGSRAGLPAAIDDPRWFVARDETVLGPMTRAELIDMAAGGRLGPDDLVCEGEDGVWVEAARVTGLLPGAWSRSDTVPAPPSWPRGGRDRGGIDTPTGSRASRRVRRIGPRAGVPLGLAVVVGLAFGVFYGYGYLAHRPIQVRIGTAGDIAAMRYGARLNATLSAMTCTAATDAIEFRFDVNTREFDKDATPRLLVRLFDRNGQHLTHFPSLQRFTVDPVVAQLSRAVGTGAGPLESDLADPAGQGRLMVLLTPRDNELRFRVAIRDLRDAAIAEIGFTP
jgi:hypothetical protein